MITNLFIEHMMSTEKKSNKQITVLSLFDGISCGMVALERAGFTSIKYYASEIDKFAIKVSEHNYPDIIRLGDVQNWKDWDIDWDSIDLLIGGSPCQGFSYAGKRLNFQDPRSRLFFIYADILNHIRSRNPEVKFLLENVKMKKEWIDVISIHLGVNPVMINSSLVSAQNRNRNYWANWEFGLPEDKGIFLKDILETPGECYEIYNSGKSIGHKLEKSYALLTRDYKGWPQRRGGMAGVISENKQLRGFTMIELERLQTLPDGYTSCCSKTQRCKQLGNCWTVDVIAHIFKHIK